MVESLFGVIAIVGLIIVVLRQQRRLGLLERELGALRSLVLSGVASARSPAMAAPPEAVQQANQPTAETEAKGAVLASEAAIARTEAAAAGPMATPARSRQDIETALGTRWAVWVGGLALAFGGVFLIRYSIESGFFSPAARLTLATLFGLVLVVVGEFIRRTGYRVPIEGGSSAYIPAILTAAGAFTLFGTVYAAYGIYGFVGPAVAILLMGVIGVATIAAALAHGQALAGLGLLGSLATPVLVASQAPNEWALFGYLAIVLIVTAFIARMRDWAFLIAAAFAGTGLWTVLYLADAPAVDFSVVLFINSVTLTALAFVWLARRGEETVQGIDWPSAVPACFVALSAFALFVNPALAGLGGAIPGVVLIATLMGVALYRLRAIALLHAAGAVTVIIFLRNALGGAFDLSLPFGSLIFEGLPLNVTGALLARVGWVLGLLFIGAGFWSARRQVASHRRAAAWAGWGVAVPLIVLAALWVAFGNLDRDLFRAVIAVALAVVFVCGGEWIAQAEQPPLSGGPAVSFALGGAGVAALLALHMAFGSGMTTVLAGALAVLPAIATRYRSYPVLGWLCVGAAAVVIGRVAFDPTIVGSHSLQTTPVFNWLLPGYGVPALAFGFAAWQLARTTNARPRLAMEAAAALFAMLTVAMLVRHAMNGGIIDTSAPTLAEQAIYTLLTLGSGAFLVALDMRSPSAVLRYGSLGMGVLSAAFIVAQHFLILNPLFTNETTGRIPFFNLLFLAYFLPAIAAAALALYTRDKRPKWYSSMLALMAAALAFAYATLSVRNLFKGEFIGLWSGLGQWETYSYSALWLAMGVGLLVGGVTLKSQVLRIASAALISIAVAKVFLFDMSELQGVLRALSFIGLGAVLIGIGLFYQRLLTRSAQ